MFILEAKAVGERLSQNHPYLCFLVLDSGAQVYRMLRLLRVYGCKDGQRWSLAAGRLV
jgi:hypothetical protein